jgi:holliday junction DNA helicase RuvA
MIAYIKGKLTRKDPTYVIIEANGLGYQVKISLTTYSQIKDSENISLNTYLHIKEDAHTLYGFSEESEKKVFLHLISISGVGPNTAMTVLSSVSAPDLEQAIVNEDIKTIQGIKGIGAKTAQRIVLELKDKIKKEHLGGNVSQMPVSGHNRLKEEALSALVTLGFARNAAEKTIDTILKKQGTEIPLEELIKIALKTA